MSWNGLDRSDFSMKILPLNSPQILSFIWLPLFEIPTMCLLGVSREGHWCSLLKQYQDTFFFQLKPLQRSCSAKGGMKDKALWAEPAREVVRPPPGMGAISGNCEKVPWEQAVGAVSSPRGNLGAKVPPTAPSAFPVPRYHSTVARKLKERGGKLAWWSFLEW